jgi:hypothetical protein
MVNRRIYRQPNPSPTLGGSMFIRNAIQFDYCVVEALESLCGVCDEVVIVDASSTDGTLDLLVEAQKRHNNLRVVPGANWECHEKFERLRILADIAKSYLKTDWHFMLQADEVIHEQSFRTIRQAIKNKNFDAYFVRRMNLWGDLNHYIRYDIAQEHKPVSDTVVRLAKIDAPAHGDAESLAVNPARCGDQLLDQILIMHYGFVRRDANMIDKTISMQSWFWGPGSQPDHRVVEMANKGGTRFEWEVMKTREMLDRIPVSHPKFVKQWAETRQAEKTFPVPD